jgi:hypothetical protein
MIWFEWINLLKTVSGTGLMTHAPEVKIKE